MRAARPTARGVALLLVAALTYVAARAFGTWELYFLAVAFVAAVGVCWVLVAASAGRLEVTRAVAPEQPVAGDPVTLSVRVRNGSRVPGLQVTLQDAAGALVAPRRPLDVPSLGSRAERLVTCGPWPVRRGVHRLPPITALAEDPLGLVRAKRVVGDPLVLTVPPRLVPLAFWDVTAGTGTRGAGRRRRPPTVDASELRGIRPHMPGEPLNRVDWKATARTGDLMLRELEDAGDGDIAVLFNAPGDGRRRGGSPGRGGLGDQPSGSGGLGRAPSGRGALGSPADDDVELGVLVAGSIADCGLRNGRGVSLLLATDGWRPLRLAPSAADRRRLLSVLAGLTPGGLDRLGPSLRTVIAGPRKRGRFRSLTLVVLSLDQALVRALVALRDEGLPLGVVLVGGAAGGGAAGEADAAPDLRRALAAAGVRVVTVAAGDDLGRVLSVPARPRRAAAL